MVVFTFSHADSFELLNAMGEVLHTEVEDGCLNFKAGFAKGYIKAFKLTNGLQGTIIDATLHQDYLAERIKIARNFYILHFDEMLFPDGLITKIGDEEMHTLEARSAVMLTSSLFTFSYNVKAGSRTRNVSVYIEEDWLAKYLNISSSDRLLKDYLLLKSSRLNFQPLDAEYRALFNDVFEATNDQPFKNIVLETRIPMLVELFFRRIADKMASVGEISISPDEIQRLIVAEAKIVEDLTTAPPAIKELARLAAMSESKFKSLFKKIYGSSPYEYFQKNRMARGNFLLRSKRYSVKETGAMLGYTNLSNFSGENLNTKTLNINSNEIFYRYS